MGWKEKDWKKTQKAFNDDAEGDNRPYDSEILRMQGLIRCHECEVPYPFMHPRCVSCDAPNREHYPNKS